MAPHMKRDDEIIIAKSYSSVLPFFPDENPTGHCYVGKEHGDSNTSNCFLSHKQDTESPKDADLEQKKFKELRLS